MRRFLLLLFSFLILFPVLVQSQQTSEIEISVSAQVSATSSPPPPPPPPPPPGGGGGGIYIPPTTKVIFKGRAYPQAFLTLSKNGQVIATFFANNLGLFEKEINGIAGGNYNFSIFAEDKKGRKSVTISFNVGVLTERTTTISGIYISPTIELTPTQVERGAEVSISGQVFPESEVNIFISSQELVKKTKATQGGDWTYQLDTGSLEEAEHQARAKALFQDGEQSPLSQTLNFLVVKKGAMVCKGADLNFDKKVNIIDFSILLYFWSKTNPKNICADINFDGIVNIIDFSVMMYYWTG